MKLTGNIRLRSKKQTGIAVAFLSIIVYNKRKNSADAQNKCFRKKDGKTVPGFQYRDDYERENTQKFEGTYTPEEIELNIKLQEECLKQTVDLAVVEELLKQGADPLGGIEIGGWGLLEHVYEKLVAESQENESVNLPALTRLFLRYGMNVDVPRVPYDGENSLNPLWSFSFIPNQNAVKALKMLLDHGLSADSFAEFYCHAIFDFYNIECGNPEKNEFWRNQCAWTYKMILLGAGYPHILENDEELADLIGCSYNTGDLQMFRNWDDFEYRFDAPGGSLAQSTLHIVSKKTGEEVWTIKA